MPARRLPRWHKRNPLFPSPIGGSRKALDSFRGLWVRVPRRSTSADGGMGAEVRAIVVQGQPGTPELHRCERPPARRGRLVVDLSAMSWCEPAGLVTVAAMAERARADAPGPGDASARSSAQRPHGARASTRDQYETLIEAAQNVVQHSLASAGFVTAQAFPTKRTVRFAAADRRRARLWVPDHAGRSLGRPAGASRSSPDAPGSTDGGSWSAGMARSTAP